MNRQSENLADKPPFRPVKMVLVVLLIVLGISGAAQWYSTNITLPRYCDDPIQTLKHVRRLLTEREPAGDGERKPYSIAARLTFRIPRESNEELEGYLSRLKQHIDTQCR